MDCMDVGYWCYLCMVCVLDITVRCAKNDQDAILEEGREDRWQGYIISAYARYIDRQRCTNNHNYNT